MAYGAGSGRVLAARGIRLRRVDAGHSALAGYIRKNGLIEPIVMHQGMVLDGRNRSLACEMAKVKPRFSGWDGECRIPELYVYSRNGTRRDLNKGQRAVAAAKLVPILTQVAKERQVAAGVHGEEGGRGKKKTLPVKRREGFTLTGSSKLSKNHPPKNEDEVRKYENETCEIAGKMMNVSGTMVRRAIVVRDADPVAFEELGMGEGTVNTEYDGDARLALRRWSPWMPLRRSPVPGRPLRHRDRDVHRRRAGHREDAHHGHHHRRGNCGRRTVGQSRRSCTTTALRTEARPGECQKVGRNGPSRW
jgi:hypothetical protein